MKTWTPPEDWQKITTIDAHTGGEPFRVITGGLPEIQGDTILERRQHMKKHLDHLRTALMWEPRGHADMYGCVVTPPVTPGADIGVLFLHNEGYSTMCGHGIIGIATVALETGMLPVIAGDVLKAIKLWHAVFARGINPSVIVYPGVPMKAGRLRFFLTSAHSEDQIRQAVDVTAEELAKL